MVPEVSEEEMDVILIAHDNHKMGLWAMTADAKGQTPQAVGWLSSKIEESGYNGFKIAMNADLLNSIKALKKAVIIKRHSETPMIESPVRVSKFNGQIEVGDDVAVSVLCSSDTNGG